MADRATVARTVMTLLGLAVGIGGMIAAPLVPSVPWWTFFLAAAVLPATGPVAAAVASRVADDEPGVPDPTDVGTGTQSSQSRPRS
jgi:NhaP-type Na+/H+ or K+/H+ antiporter